MNIWDVIICAILALALVSAIAVCKKRKKGGCCGDCGKCAGACCCKDNNSKH